MTMKDVGGGGLLYRLLEELMKHHHRHHKALFSPLPSSSNTMFTAEASPMSTRTIPGRF